MMVLFCAVVGILLAFSFAGFYLMFERVVRTELDRRLQETAAIQRLVLDSQLPAALRDPIANKFDELVSDYIISQGVIERLDDKRLSFNERDRRAHV